jgi:hypothetical protein
MGVWGAGIYHNDDSCQAKDDFIFLIRSGLSAEEATSEILERYKDLLEDIDVEAPIIFALAEVQWKYGRLVEYIKDRAVEIIETGIELERWRGDAPELLQAREKVLAELNKKLHSLPPAEKEVKPLRKSLVKPRNLFPKGKVGFAYAVEVDKGLFAPFVLHGFYAPTKDITPVFYALPYVFATKEFTIDSIPTITKVATIMTGLGGINVFGMFEFEVGKSFYAGLYEIGEFKNYAFTTNEVYPSYVSINSLFEQMISQSEKVL